MARALTLILAALLFLVAVTVLAKAADKKPTEPASEPSAPIIQPSLVGHWMMTWRGGSGQASFHQDGSYACSWHGQTWTGKWSEVKGVLTVSESTGGGGDPDLVWRVKLKPGARKGVIDDGSDTFSLEHLKPTD